MFNGNFISFKIYSLMFLAIASFIDNAKASNLDDMEASKKFVAIASLRNSGAKHFVDERDMSWISAEDIDIEVENEMEKFRKKAEESKKQSDELDKNSKDFIENSRKKAEAIRSKLAESIREFKKPH